MPATPSSLVVLMIGFATIAALVAVAAEAVIKSTTKEMIASIEVKIKALAMAATANAVSERATDINDRPWARAQQPSFFDDWYPEIKTAVNAAIKKEGIAADSRMWEFYDAFLRKYTMGEEYLPPTHAVMGYLAPALAMQLIQIAKRDGNAIPDVVIVTPSGHAEVRMCERLVYLGNTTNAITIATSVEEPLLRGNNTYVILVDERHVLDAAAIMRIVTRQRLVRIKNWTPGIICMCGRLSSSV